MEQHHSELAAAGVQIVAVGLGRPEHARATCGHLAPSIRCLTNEMPHLNHRYGLASRSVRQLLTLDFVRANLRALWGGHRQRRATGEVGLLPGTFLVDREGVIQAVHYSEHPGDNPDLAALIS